MKRSAKATGRVTVAYAEYLCDLCGAPIYPGEHVDGEWRGAAPRHVVSVYTEAGGIRSGERAVEFCGDCFAHRVEPALKAIGLKI